MDASGQADGYIWQPKSVLHPSMDKKLQSYLHNQKRKYPLYRQDEKLLYPLPMAFQIDFENLLICKQRTQPIYFGEIDTQNSSQDC